MFYLNRELNEEQEEKATKIRTLNGDRSMHFFYHNITWARYEEIGEEIKALEEELCMDLWGTDLETYEKYIKPREEAKEELVALKEQIDKILEKLN